MQFLADESCDFAVVRALRANGHDVISVSEVTPRADDSEVIAFAVREKRILLTEDKDFGRLVFAHGKEASGVIFIRYHTAARTRLAEDIVQLVEKYGEKLKWCFVTIRPGYIRQQNVFL